jgi:ABC-2 type transport system permease protein
MTNQAKTKNETCCSPAQLYLRFVSMHLSSAMEYKTSFFMSVFGMTLTSLASFFAIWVLFARFHSVDGYTFSEVLLCHSTVWMSFSFSEIFLRGFDTFSGQVQSGGFDRMLLRPRATLFSVLCARIEFARVGRFLQSAAVMVYAVLSADVRWTPSHVLAYILMILGGTVVFTGLFIIYASVCFFTTEGLEFMNIFTDGGRQFGAYPFSIYGDGILRFCTFVVPLALCQYYPLLYLTGRVDTFGYALLPLLSAIFLIPCLLLWRLGIHHYKSTGS